MTTAPPGHRSGAVARPNPQNPPAHPQPARHTERMALRFTVQGDDEAETAAGLQLLLDAGLETVRPPTDMIGNGWMARAVPPRTTKAPTAVEDDRGRASGA